MLEYYKICGVTLYNQHTCLHSNNIPSINLPFIAFKILSEIILFIGTNLTAIVTMH